MRKFLILFLLLSGCDGVANNRIGHEVPLGQEIAVDCVDPALKTIEGIQNMRPIENGYFFKINRYEVRLIFRIKETTISSYDIDINGQFVGEEIGVFYSNALKFSNKVKEVVLNDCGNNL